VLDENGRFCRRRLVLVSVLPLGLGLLGAAAVFLAEHLALDAGWSGSAVGLVLVDGPGIVLVGAWSTCTTTIRDLRKLPH
jgi:hypothetical protein